MRTAPPSCALSHSRELYAETHDDSDAREVWRRRRRQKLPLKIEARASLMSTRIEGARGKVLLFPFLGR